MADGKKTYIIEINGIKESIDAVKTLTTQLDELQNKVDTLNSKGISVNSSVNRQALQEEDSLMKQIAATQEKVTNTRREEYQQLLNAKAELKEYAAVAKSLNAQRNIESGINDTSTMQGMKMQLADLKSAMQTMDVESEKFKEWQSQANELNNKLKEIEQGYGQFGRNVGNYANGVVEGMQQIVIKVGDTQRTFSSAKEAARELGNELKTMSINGQQGTKEFKALQKEVMKLESTIGDMKKSSTGMDFLLDSMKGMAAIASTSKGISAFFDYDDTKVQETIQKLLALQSALQGIEQITQLMRTEEGVIGWISKGNDAIDSFVDNLLGASKAQETLNSEMVAGKTASEGFAAAETAQAAATTTATVATKALSFALKTIGIGLIISLVATLITYWKDIYKWFTDTIPALKNLGTWFDKLKSIALGVGTAIINYMVQPLATLGKVIQSVIKGNFSEIPNIIMEGLKKTYDIAGNYRKGYQKEEQRQQDEHNKKMREKQRKANEDQLKDEEAKYGTSHKRTQEYLKKQMELTEKGSDEYKDLQRRLWADERREKEENEQRNNRDAKRYSENRKKLDKQLADEEIQAQKSINEYKIALMSNGIQKELAMLDLENKEKVEKIKAGGKRVQELLDLQSKLYAKQQEEIWEKTNEEIDKNIKEANISKIRAEIEKLNNEMQDLMNSKSVYRKPVSTDEYTKAIFGLDFDTLDKVTETEFAKLNRHVDEYRNKYTEAMMAFVRTSSDEIKQEFLNINDSDGTDAAFAYLEAKYEEYYNRYLSVIRSYGNLKDSLVLGNENKEKQILNSSFSEKIRILDEYYKSVLQKEKENLAERNNLQLEALKKEKEAELQALDKETQDKMFGEDYLAEYEKGSMEYEKALDVNRGIYENYLKRKAEIEQRYANKEKEIAIDTAKELGRISSEYYEDSLDAVDAYLSKVMELQDKQPVFFKTGFINVKETKKNYKELESTVTNMMGKIRDLRVKVGLDTTLLPEERNALLENLDRIERDVTERAEEINKKLKTIMPDFWKQVQQVGSIIGNAAVQVLQSIDQIADAAHEKEMDKIDKELEDLEEAYDKQRALTEKYAGEVNDIEDELSNARGDRREHLIDQLNAQIAAQRASWAEEKRIEKEKEKLDKKRKDMEYKNDMRKWNNSKKQAYLNAALAISEAAVNKWPLPAIPMIAAATAIGAAQIAAVLAQKPQKLGKGGIIQGKSHAQGGVPVLGGQAEVEGGEFITNKRTTSQNSDLLYYINSKKKRVDLEDMLEFYNDKPRKSISSINRKFADGGVLPTTIPEINVNDRLLTALEYYSSKPTYVSVVEIENKMEDVRHVRAIAGKE